MTRQETLCRSCADWLRERGCRLKPKGRKTSIECGYCGYLRHGKTYDFPKERQVKKL